MTTHDVYVKEIIQGPYYYADKNEGYWKVVIQVYCDGRFDERTMKANTIQEIEKYKPGYSWVE